MGNPAPNYTSTPSIATRPHKLAFVVDMGVRGTSVSSYDFADLAEKMGLSPTPLILYGRGEVHDVFSPDLLRKYRDRFGTGNVHHIACPRGPSDELDALLLQANVTHLYTTIARDGEKWMWSRLPGVKNLMHIVFDTRARTNNPSFVKAKMSVAVGPYGMRTPFDMPVVPLVVREIGEPPWTLHGPTLRQSLGIPHSATVFCRHGGPTRFDMTAAHQAVVQVASLRPDMYFLFLNTNRFAPENVSNIIHLPMRDSRDYLPTFIRSCDAMVHGRSNGENFGLAIAEFSTLHKPVFTTPSNSPTNARETGVGKCVQATERVNTCASSCYFASEQHAVRLSREIFSQLPSACPRRAWLRLFPPRRRQVTRAHAARLQPERGACARPMVERL